ncbi:hypothetical protein ARALYDRAFT_331244 [Arabidopsis lyrata subsp. lyrata]|uniref:3'-5' exonuclease domain-containing protein n=1 Tax=Arabidopsis lyrata subsp. lyrata TaxID=81972 RepID=D7MLM6_ARALL|nr:hypothetical protein ARALYDRAFT_331244 [Arabidopsis lyrata subsp. lyrata]
MSSSIVKIGIDSIKTTVTEKESDSNRLVKTFLSNKNNRKKIIGLDTEHVQKGRNLNKTVLLQLCDGDNCLIVQLPNEGEGEGDLFSIFSTYPSLHLLESEFGLTCKNVVEIGPATWKLTNMTADVKFRLSTIVSTERPTNAVLDDWEKFVLNKNQIKLAASNAYFAFGIGNILLDVFGF